MFIFRIFFRSDLRAFLEIRRLKFIDDILIVLEEMFYLDWFGFTLSILRLPVIVIPFKVLIGFKGLAVIVIVIKVIVLVEIGMSCRENYAAIIEIGVIIPNVYIIAIIAWLWGILIFRFP